MIAPAALTMLEYKPVKELYHTYLAEFLVVLVTAATGATLGIEQVLCKRNKPLLILF